jgi:hypothetical protein
VDLTDYPALRYHAAGTIGERQSAREDCCARYGRADIGSGRMWQFVREELGRFRALPPCPPEPPGPDPEPFV